MMIKFLIYVNIKLKKLLMIMQNRLYIRRHQVKLHRESYEALKTELITPYLIASWIEKNIRYVSDRTIDFPQKAILTFTRKQGDCEDYSILIADLLHNAGMQTKIVDMYFPEKGNVAGHSIAIFSEFIPGGHRWGVIGTGGYIAPRFGTVADIVKSYGWETVGYAIRNHRYDLEQIVWITK